MKKLSLVLLAIILIGTCYGNLTAPPFSHLPAQLLTVNINARVTHLSEKEFLEVGTSGIENPNIDDFRQLDFKVEICNSARVTEKKLTIPHTIEFKKLLTTDRLWFGGEYDQNNDGEATSVAQRHYVLFYKGLTDEAFTGLLSPVMFHVSWVNSDGSKTSKDYKLVDYLTFE